MKPFGNYDRELFYVNISYTFHKKNTSPLQDFEVDCPEQVPNLIPGPPFLFNMEKKPDSLIHLHLS